MRDKIKNWYCAAYPTDDLGKEIPQDITFKDLFNALDHGEDVYELLGDAADSIIRERCFVRLSDIMDCDYSYIYDQWLYGGRMRYRIFK